MATLRSGKKLDSSNDNNNETAEEKGKGVKEVKDRTTLVVFIGLLIDLLGEIATSLSIHICHVYFTAFTLILPLFPALISHYRENDSSGLFAALENKVDWFRTSVGAPVEFNTVLFGGFLGSIFSFLQFIASPIIGGLSDRLAFFHFDVFILKMLTFPLFLYTYPI